MKDPPPVIDLSGKSRQKLDKAVEVRVECDEPCIVRAQGKLSIQTARSALRAAGKFKLRPDSVELEAGERAKLALKVKKKGAKSAKKALRLERKVKAKVTVSAQDANGNTNSERKAIRLRTA